ncbi:MAG: multiheme c-type cytochrome [Isosphaeraceae bacterium]|nr:multiheme c-type cytochrome [Isosphaeraceae bacterium]
MPARRWLRTGAALVIIAGCRHVASGDTIPDVRPLERASAGFRGAGSCSAVACHGSPTPSPPGQNVLKNEHTTWVTQDKHSSAFQVLFTERSATMAKALGIPAAHESARCLVCHTTPAPSVERTAWAGEGVSCESCHGPADAWLGPHTTAGWRQLTPHTREERFGLIATKDIPRRAELCATCHVGEPARNGRPARDVNHDLIAAGHPALRFELSAYLALMPSHWVEKGPNAAGDFPARAWAVGQVASAKASLALLSDRAGRGSWPELAEYSCFSCHRPIDGPGGSSTSPARSSTPWGTWNHTFGASVAGIDSLGTRADIKPELDLLKRLMETASPDPKEVSDRARGIADRCAEWLVATPAAPIDQRTLRALIVQVRGSPPGDWDGEAQRYLAAIALRQAFAGLQIDPQGALPDTAELRRVRRDLQFAAGLDQPRSLRSAQGFGGAGGTAPRGNGGP